MVEKELAALKSEAEVSRTLRELRSMGSEVIYRAADIRDADSVDQIIQNVAETCGRVDVVIHGAGIDVSRALRSKTLEQIENVLSVKIQGMRNVLASLESHGMPPRRIVGLAACRVVSAIWLRWIIRQQTMPSRICSAEPIAYWMRKRR